MKYLIPLLLLFTCSAYGQETAADTVKYNMRMASKRGPITDELSLTHYRMRELTRLSPAVREYLSLQKKSDSLFVELEKFPFMLPKGQPFTSPTIRYNKATHIN